MQEMTWLQRVGARLGMYRWCGGCRQMRWFVLCFADTCPGCNDTMSPY
jgi:hypothetical protein